MSGRSAQSPVSWTVVIAGVLGAMLLFFPKWAKTDELASVPAVSVPAVSVPAVSTEAPMPSPEHTDEDGDEEDSTPATVPVVPPHDANAKPAIERDGMVFVQGGTFLMGSSEKNAPGNERPAKVVKTKSFWIDRTEVTVGAYRACVDRGACQRPPWSSPWCTYDRGEAQFPVSCVPWASAKAYCESVSKRLPREVEWEFTARGTSQARYPWGGRSTGCSVAVTLVRENSQRSCGGKLPKKVGSLPLGASPFGALDMSGNVEEWVADWYAENASAVPPRAGASHVLRGGGFLTPPSLARTTSRNWGSTREAGPNVGFRCAQDEKRERRMR